MRVNHELASKYFVRNNLLATFPGTEFGIFAAFCVYTQVHRKTWGKEPIDYWKRRLFEETHELEDAMANRHHHPPESERLQLAATHTNLLFNLAGETYNVPRGPKPDEVNDFCLAGVCATNNQYRLSVYELILKNLARKDLRLTPVATRTDTVTAGYELIDLIPNRPPKTKKELAPIRKQTVKYVSNLLRQIIDIKRPFDYLWGQYGGSPYGVPVWQFLRFEQSVLDTPDQSFEKFWHDALIKTV